MKGRGLTGSFAAFMVVSAMALVFFLVYFLMASWVAVLFALSVLAAVAFAGIYADEKPRKLALSFVVVGLLFLIGVPLANLYTAPERIHGVIYVTAVYQRFTVSFILMCIGFLLLGSVMVFYKIFRIGNQYSKKLPSIDQNKAAQSIGNADQQGNRDKPLVHLTKLGFIICFFGALSFLGVVIAYTPKEGWMGMSLSNTYPYSAYVMPLICTSVVLYVLGLALMLHNKSAKFGFTCVIIGSSALIAASFAYIYQTIVKTIAFYTEQNPVYVTNFINPWRGFTLPLLITGATVTAIGYAFIFMARSAVD